MVCVAMGLSTNVRVTPIFMDHLRYSGPIFGIMVFVAAQAVIFWRVSPPLVLLLGAPLVALTLYQRSAVRHRVAEEAASTDSLTGLKNRRAFEEEAGRMLGGSPQSGKTVALCLIDIDRFKQVNDRHGHLVGDTILEALVEGDRGHGARVAATGWAATNTASSSRARPPRRSASSRSCSERLRRCTTSSRSPSP